MYFIRLISLPILALAPLFVHAQNKLYTTPLTRIPGITDAQTLSTISTYGLAGFLNGLITFIFTAAAIASVVMIVIIGFQYATTEQSGPNLSFLKGKIKSVAFGVAVIASMFIIFKFINPQIVSSLEVLSPTKDIGNAGAAEGTFVSEEEYKELVKQADDMQKNFPLSGEVLSGNFSEEAAQASAKARAEAYQKSIDDKCSKLPCFTFVKYNSSSIIINSRYEVYCYITVGQETKKK